MKRKTSFRSFCSFRLEISYQTYGSIRGGRGLLTCCKDIDGIMSLLCACSGERSSAAAVCVASAAGSAAATQGGSGSAGPQRRLQEAAHSPV